MLFRDQYDSGKGAGAVGTGVASQHDEDDETSSTGGRSYTSAESAAAQSFEQRMAQLNNTTRMVPDSRSGSDVFYKEDSGIGGGAHAYLTPGYQLFSKVGRACGETDADDIDDLQQSLSMLAQTNESDDAESTCAGRKSTSGRRRESFVNDDNDEDADYLATLLSNIERHAERLDTQFYRYPPSDVIKQQMAMAAPLSEGKPKGHAAATGKGAATAGSGSATISAKEDDAPDIQCGSGSALSPSSSSQGPAVGSPTAPSPTVSAAPASPQGPGTKLFLGGLRYEVIQSGRHMVSWIFQVACGVHLSPSSILIHRKTRNGRSNVAPTGCASVFVTSEADVQALLDVNQRIYCAEEGVYVSPSPEIMKELIASKDIVDVTGGRVRGPTHPVVIERAYSFSHHHVHRECGGSGSRGHGGTGGGAAAGGSGGLRHARTTSSASTESNLSVQLRGALPPPYGSVPPPQYGTAPGSSSGMPGSLQPPSYAPSAVSSSMGMGAVPLDGSLRRGASSTPLYPSSAALSGQSSPSLQPVLGDALASNPISAPKALDPQRVTFHAYLRGDGVPHTSAAALPPSVLSATASNSAAHHTVLFVAALPTEATPHYVSWLFSLMSIALHPSQIHIIGCGGGGGSSNPTASGSPGGASPVGVAKNKADSCATVNLGESDAPIALNYHHRVLCTSRGAWIGYSAQDMAALRASDASLHDCPLLHVDRRMSAPAVSGVVRCDSTATEISGYPHGGSGGDFWSSGAAPYPPMQASYSPPLFSNMPIMPAGNMGGGSSTMPLPMQWGFNMPSSFPNCMNAGVPPPPPAGVMGGPAASAMGARAPPPPPNVTMPPQGVPAMPPPFPFPQAVTIGDRIYQIPPGSTVQFVPVITPAGGTGAGGDAEGGTGGASGGLRRSGPPGFGNASKMEVPEKPSSDASHLDISLPFSTRPSPKHAEP
ncbi:hypothetical protein CUR178_01986 [Leishmania enriettii]|uniref:Uncharacterized protein n=1 Tax=Leishmania enriettii TaxID=5663 RepID=A0A836GQA7_LEIEN|nr:hypothetical protein CUR178_01986 [Leishmania enriettii]